MFRITIHIITFILLVVLCTDIHCQIENHKNGAYRNHIDFHNNKPFNESDYKFIYKENLRVPKLHQVISINGDVKMRTIKKSIWGIYYNNAFYLNAQRLGMINGYIKIDSIQKHCYFKGIPIKSLAQEERLNRSARDFGLTGLAVTSTKIAIENKDKIHYVLNIETGMINLLTKNYITRLLKPYDNLLLSFDAEENNNSFEILLKYLDLINNIQ